MFGIGVVIFSVLLVQSRSEENKLPSWFKFGAASSAFQVEGGWIASDRSESVWDRQLHVFPETLDGNADVACDSYHLWRRDIEMCEELGLDMYRFSISWSRLLPSGFPNHISEDGKNYYNNLIDGLLEKGIEPVVTLYHFDLPQRLQNLGGWANPLISNWFADYARVVFSLYADRVKTWLTLNEPIIMCDNGYNKQTVPYLDDVKIGRFLCNKHVLIAHAKAYRIYEKEYKLRYNVPFMMVELIDADPCVMFVNGRHHLGLAITLLPRPVIEGRYGNAIYSKDGGWPKKLEKYLAKKSKMEGYPEPRLPPFTDDEVALVKGTFDFYALNHYSTHLVRKARPGEEIGRWPGYGSQELGVVLENDPSWGTGDAAWFSVYPEGLRKQLNYLKDTYGVSEFLITENGFFSTDPSLNDTRTVEYTRKHLEQVALAIQDGVNVTGYIHWSIMDNFDKGYEASVSHSCGYVLEFPSWFKFGAASAAYQVEGAWNVSDKGESKWDRLTHRYPEVSSDGSNGDDACNSYYLWERDIEMAAELGLQFYRFSISWPRLLPTGLADKVSEDGRKYYNNLIDGLLEKGIEPVVTIYHWDMPQMLQDLGGWANPQISDWFADYARIVYSFYGDRVKTWITINEPLVECDWYYGWGVLAPELDYYVGPYICNKNLLLAHAKAYHVYDEEFRYRYNGKVSIANHFLWLQPYSPEDHELTEIARQFITGRYTHPIFSKEGGWPSEVEEIIARVSKENGFKESRLPAFTQEEKALIRGTYDYIGFNHYTTKLVRKPEPSDEIVRSVLTYIGDLDVVLVDDPSWTFGYSQVMAANPQGIREQMAWLKEEYGDIEILITENGYSTEGSNLTDDSRISFINDYLEQVLLSINDGVNVTGYAYWTIMDNFEWIDGYQSKFGLYEVDFSVPMRTRTARNSAVYYSSVIRERSLNVSSETNEFD